MADKQLVDYYIQQSNERFDKIEKRFDKIDAELKTIIALRWQLAGGLSVLLIVLSFGVNILLRFLKF